MKKAVPHLTCLVLTFAVCALIYFEGGEMFSGQTKVAYSYNLNRYQNKKIIETQVASRAQTSEKLQKQRPSLLSYTVKAGDTLWGIANKYDVSVETLIKLNRLKNANRLQIGQKLTILTADGIIHPVSRGESLWSISRTYDTSVEDIIWANNLKQPDILQIGQKLIIPGIHTAKVTAKAAVNTSTTRLSFIWPLRSIISSYYGPRWGRFHSGIDIAASKGTDIKAAADGTVEAAGWLGNYGYMVLLNHGAGIKTRYAHASKLLVKKGQKVKQGEVIAKVGNTGRSTGPHLHFEVIINGRTKNPLSYLP